MSKLSDEAARLSVVEICEKMSKDGFDFSQDVGEIKKVVREEFYKVNGQNSITRPKLLGIIAKAIDSYITTTEETISQTTPNVEQEESTAKPTAQATPAPDRTRRKRQVNIDDIVNDVKKQDMNLRSNSSKSKSYVEFGSSTLNGINIKVGNNAFELKNDVKPATDFDPDFTKLDDAEQSLIELIVGVDEANKYLDSVNTYIEEITKLRKAYPITDKKKSQKFTFIKKDKRVKFYNPAQSNKLDYLSEKEASSIVRFNENLLTFEKLWKEGISAKAFKPLEYLKLPVIRTQNIMKFEVVRDSYKDLLSENTSKLTNTVLSFNASGECENLSEAQIGKIPVDKYAPDYMMLFSDLKTFNGSQFQRVIKNIYNHRSGIVLHPKCSTEFKKKCWLQAYANIVAIDEKSLTEPQEQMVITAWKNVLSSRFAYHIIMDCVPESSLFNKAMIELIQEGTSIKLFESVLYPISFVFTPFMLGYDGFTLPKSSLTNATEATYKKDLGRIFFEFGSSVMKLYEYEPCLWIYYGEGKSKNVMVDLLHNIVLTTETKKKEKKSTGKKSGSSKTNDEHQDEEEQDDEHQEEEEQ